MKSSLSFQTVPIWCEHDEVVHVTLWSSRNKWWQNYCLVLVQSFWAAFLLYRVWHLCKQALLHFSVLSKLVHLLGAYWWSACGCKIRWKRFWHNYCLMCFITLGRLLERMCLCLKAALWCALIYNLKMFKYTVILNLFCVSYLNGAKGSLGAYSNGRLGSWPKYNHNVKQLLLLIGPIVTQFI